jgi:hypothetical protein
MSKDIEVIVEKVANCRFTGNPKTCHSEESYKTTLTIVLAKILQSQADQYEREKKQFIKDIYKAISDEEAKTYYKEMAQKYGVDLSE